MQDVLQGFRLIIDNIDFGAVCEEGTPPVPTPKQQEYQGGGMDLAVNLNMMALEPMECTLKLSGMPPEMNKLLARAPNRLSTVTLRGSAISILDNTMRAHVYTMQGQINGGSKDAMQRGEKSGMEVVVNQITRYRHVIGSEVVHDIRAYPPRRIIGGVDQLEQVNAHLGYT